MTEPPSFPGPGTHSPEQPVLESLPLSGWISWGLCMWLAIVLIGFFWLRVLQSSTVQRLLSTGR